MVSILNPPKDSLKLLAENLGKFEQIRDSWITSGNLLYADFSEGVYEAAALFLGKVILLQFHVPKDKEIVEVPTGPETKPGPESSE